jgi:hypothetical protein
MGKNGSAALMEGITINRSPIGANNATKSVPTSQSKWPIKGPAGKEEYQPTQQTNIH